MIDKLARDLFARSLAAGLTVAEAANRAGISRRSGFNLAKELRAAEAKAPEPKPQEQKKPAPPTVQHPATGTTTAGLPSRNPATVVESTAPRVTIRPLERAPEPERGRSTILCDPKAGLREVTCRACGGEGRVPDQSWPPRREENPWETCSRCGGWGTVETYR